MTAFQPRLLQDAGSRRILPHLLGPIEEVHERLLAAIAPLLLGEKPRAPQAHEDLCRSSCSISITTFIYLTDDGLALLVTTLSDRYFLILHCRKVLIHLSDVLTDLGRPITRVRRLEHV